MKPRAVDVQDFINSHPFSRYQGLILVLCFLVVAIDGFDTAAIGFIAPAIRHEWGLSAAALAPLFGAGLFGLMAGAFLFGPLADRFGRKTLLVATCAIFGIMTLASAFSTSVEMLVVLRFLTGLGLGGAMPNTVTLTAEYCPEQRRSFLVTTMFCGFTIGSALGGFLAAYMVDLWGWRSVLMLGGLVPLVLVPFLAALLPESVRFLVLKGGQEPRIARSLGRIAPAAELNGATFTGVHHHPGSPVSQLFTAELLRGTLLLWLSAFMSLLIIYLLSSWLPTIINATGASLKAASLITVLFQVGGTIGAIILGRLMDRHNPPVILALSYGLGAVFVALIGSLTASPLLVGAAVFGAGFCVSGSQVGLNALSAAYYPTTSRATGVSWTNAVGRTGSVLGSMMGGAMLALGWGLPAMFLVVALPAAVAAVAMLAMGLSRRAAARAAVAAGT
ncbi:MFS transporter [Pseudoxanthobacter sp.]|uniref:MFS transporter n=1 Tax=Pseudoxanthobacter sp. TaxID=1925742 RepID=UPI002FDF8BCC